MRAELRLTDAQYSYLRAHLLSDDDEHAALLICGTAGDTTLACRRVVPLSGEDLQSSGKLHLHISPLSLARLAKQAAREAETLVVCHSHPFPGVVRPSSIDLVTEEELCGRVLPGRLSGRGVGALILGPDGFSGRLWRNGKPMELNLTIGGRRVNVPKGHSEVDDWEDRQMLLWGAAGQQRLRDARVVVVGAGGTGSHVVSQLAHLGVGHIVIVDHDVVEPSNLSRVVGATPDTIGLSKVQVLKASAQRIRPALTVDAVAASLVDIDAAWLGQFDAVVCCTDGHGSRALLNELAAQYLIPLIDLGMEVQPGPDGSRAGGGVRVIRPGDPCLHCMAILDPALVREEFLTDDDRSIEVARGYLRGLREPAPAVIALNGVVASLAVVELIDLIVGVFRLSPVRLLYRAEARVVTLAAAQRDPACWVCGDTGILGLGDARRLPRRRQPRIGSA